MTSKEAAEDIKRRYGKDHYRKIGAMGGKKSRKGGFYANRELASIAGRKGGSVSGYVHRNKAKSNAS